MDFNRETGQKNAENDASVSSLIDVNEPHTEKRTPIPKKKMSKNYITFRIVFLVGIMILIAVLTGFHLKEHKGRFSVLTLQ